MNIFASNFFYRNFKVILFSYAILICLLIPYILYINQLKLLALLLFSLPLILLLDNFDRYLKPAFVFCMFIYVYIYQAARIQAINLFSYFLIVYFLININSGLFNSNPLPKLVRISSALLIFAVFLSSVNSPFVSIQSVYYAVMFFIYILTGYIIYRTLRTMQDVDEYLKYFIYACSVYAVLIIISIFLTGYSRARGITGTAFSDIIICSLLVVLFKHIFSEKSTALHIGMAILLFIVLITDQSRFAWIGFSLSFIYGLVISTFIQRDRFMRKRIVYVFYSVFLGILLIFISGLYKLILLRFSDVSLSILQASGEKEIIGNSLDTRGIIWLTAFNTFLNNPVTGVGYFMFHVVSENYNVLPGNLYYDIVKGLDAHSTFMNFLCETGLIGFLSILFLFVLVYVLSFKAIKLSESTLDKSRSIVLNILVFFIITTSVYSGAFTFDYNGYFLYFILALVVANYVILKKPNYVKTNKEQAKN